MGIISSYMNLIGNSINQSFNADQAAINRRWQEQMYQKQFSDNVQLWKMQQDYNSPVNQVARYKDAGINPYLALQNISTGSAQSAPQSAQAGSGAQATGTAPHFAGIGQSIYNLLRLKDEREVLKQQAQNLASESLGNRIDAMTRHAKNIAEIGKYLSGSAKDKADAALSETFAETDKMLRGYKTQQYMNESLESYLRSISHVQTLNAFPERLRLEIAEKTANLALMKDQGNLNAEEYRKRVYETVWTEAKAAHAHLDYKTAQRIADDIVEQSNYSTKSKPWLDAMDRIIGFSREFREWKPTNAKAGKLSGKTVFKSANGTKKEYYHYYE